MKRFIAPEIFYIKAGLFAGGMALLICCILGIGVAGAAGPAPGGPNNPQVRPSGRQPSYAETIAAREQARRRSAVTTQWGPPVEPFAEWVVFSDMVSCADPAHPGQRLTSIQAFRADLKNVSITIQRGVCRLGFGGNYSWKTSIGVAPTPVQFDGNPVSCSITVQNDGRVGVSGDVSLPLGSNPTATIHFSSPSPVAVGSPIQVAFTVNPRISITGCSSMQVQSTVHSRTITLQASGR